MQGSKSSVQSRDSRERKIDRLKENNLTPFSTASGPLPAKAEDYLLESTSLMSSTSFELQNCPQTIRKLQIGRASCRERV